MESLAFGKQQIIYGMLIVAAIIVSASVFFVIRFEVTAQTVDWPPLTMIYEVEQIPAAVGEVPPEKSVVVHRLEYQSKGEWLDEVIESKPVQTRVGVFTNTGSYQSLSGGVYTTYSSITNSTDTEKVADGVNMIPRAGLSPFPIQIIEDNYGIELTRISTDSKVCFRSQCDEKAEGLLWVDNGRETVFADDARGIPLKIRGSFIVKELRIHDDKQAVAR